jgi:hypothetical protein
LDTQRFLRAHSAKDVLIGRDLGAHRFQPLGLSPSVHAGSDAYPGRFQPIDL